ncbi:MAG: class I SAM-dependent methyltransferase [Acidimicrobiales bacterium]|nr:class I SAM-dependent methyltransferase [Acidimicrobiales bacterium]
MVGPDEPGRDEPGRDEPGRDEPGGDETVAGGPGAGGRGASAAVPDEPDAHAMDVGDSGADAPGFGDVPRGGRADGESGTWFRPLADHMGETYLRYSFTKGTDQEADFLVGLLDLGTETRVLDAGCGPGRHVRALRARGVPTVGVDLAESFCRLVVHGDSPAPAAVADVRALPTHPAFDAVISLCQGGFGLLGGPGAPLDADVAAVRQLASALRPGGRLVLSAFSSYFQVRHQADEGGEFDVDAGVMHERTQVKDRAGTDLDADLWTTGFTPRELRLVTRLAGLEPDHVWSVDPGDYARRTPDLDHAEFLLLAHKP